MMDADANDKCIGAPKTTVGSHHQAKQLALDPQIKVDECGLALAVMTSQLSTPQVDTATLLGPEIGNQAMSRSQASSPVALHSRPSATRKIFLDFDGDTFPASTPWLDYFGASPGATLNGFSLDSDYSTFSLAENVYIEEVWRAVAEDFAAINVDVTTEDPGVAGLTRSSSSDSNFGAHAVISDDNAFQQKCRCGGVAYIGVVDWIKGTYFTSDYNPYSPNFNFLSFSPGSRVNSADAAGIVSHETGHNLGMAHDGTTTSSYYPGHSNGLWGTIMGTTYSRAISQWSKKEYRNARVTDAFTNIDDEWINNPDCMARPSCLDTFSVFAGNSMPLISDDYGQTAGTAEVISSRTFSFDGYIGSGGDEDWFKISTSQGGKLTVTAETIKDFANLDIHLSVLNSNGIQITFNDPVAFRGSNGKPGGLNASLTNYTLNAGTYFIRVKGTGALDPLDTGYSSYASVGKYSLSGTLLPSNTQTITFAPPTSLSMAQSPYTLTATASSGLTPVLTSSTQSICTVEGTSLAILSNGTCNLAADQAGDDSFNAAPTVTRSIKILSAQSTLSISTSNTSAYIVGAKVSLNVSGGSGSGTVTYALAVANARCTIATVSGTTTVTTSTGGPTNCVVVATKAADSNFAAITSAQKAFNFLGAQSALVVSNLATPGQTGSTINLSTSGGNGEGAVTYAIAPANARCIITENSLAVTVGAKTTCSVVATKAATAEFAQATSAAKALTFLNPQATLTISNPIKSGFVGTAITLTTSGGSGRGAVTFTTSTPNCSITSGRLTASLVTTCSVTAFKAADNDYWMQAAEFVLFVFR